MNWKRIIPGVFVLAMLATPATAGSFGVYGSHWDDFNAGIGLGDVDIKATPVDGGLRVNLLPSGPVNPYVGAGVTYCFLDPDQGDMDDETGWYAAAGLELGGPPSRRGCSLAPHVIETFELGLVRTTVRVTAKVIGMFELREGSGSTARKGPPFGDPRS